MALFPVIEGTGDVIADWNGAASGVEADGRDIAAANPALHEQALAALA